IKNYFSPFFLIFLFILGPVFLLEAILLLVTGTGFFRQLGIGSNTFEQIIMGFDEDVFVQATAITNLATFATLVLIPLVTIYMILARQEIKDGESFTAGGLIIQAAKRFGAVLGSSIIVRIIFFAVLVVAIMFIVIPRVVIANDSPVFGV